MKSADRPVTRVEMLFFVSTTRSADLSRTHRCELPSLPVQLRDLPVQATSITSASGNRALRI